MAIKARTQLVTNAPTKLTSTPADRTAGQSITAVTPAASTTLVRYGGPDVTWAQGFISDQVGYSNLQSGEELWAITQTGSVTINVIEGGV